MNWIPTTQQKHPEKPGLKRYEQIPCLVVKGGQIQILQWNCEHLVWDDASGDDYYCDVEDVSHWMPLSDLPTPESTP